MEKNKNAALFLKAFTEELLYHIGNDFAGEFSPNKLEVLERKKREFRKIIHKPSKPLKPTPLIKKLHLGKIEQLVSNPGIGLIECPGPGKFILVKTLKKTSPTGIILSEREIKDIIYEFARFSKKPLPKEVFHTKVGNLEITSIISGMAGSRFMISKYV